MNSREFVIRIVILCAAGVAGVGVYQSREWLGNQTPATNVLLILGAAFVIFFLVRAVPRKANVIHPAKPSQVISLEKLAPENNIEVGGGLAWAASIVIATSIAVAPPHKGNAITPMERIEIWDAYETRGLRRFNSIDIRYVIQNINDQYVIPNGEYTYEKD